MQSGIYLMKRGEVLQGACSHMYTGPPGSVRELVITLLLFIKIIPTIVSETGFKNLPKFLWG